MQCLACVNVFFVFLSYIRSSMQTVRRMADAIAASEYNFPSARETVAAIQVQACCARVGLCLSHCQLHYTCHFVLFALLQKSMLGHANAWSLTDGVTTKVAAGGPEFDQSALSLILQWRTSDGSQNQVYDLDMEVCSIFSRSTMSFPCNSATHMDMCRSQ